MVRRIEEPLPAGATLSRLGRRRVVVARPYVHYFGHEADEILFALSYARLLDLPMVFLRPRYVVSEALYELDSDEVRIIRSPIAKLLLRTSAVLLGAAQQLHRWKRRFVDNFRQEQINALSRYREAHPLFSRAVTLRLRELRRELKGKKESRNVATKATSASDRLLPYWRRRLIADPVRVRPTVQAERRAREAAAHVGIDPDTKLVTLHARERGYKLGNEVQDKDVRDDSVRNARIEAHFAAVDFLVERGYTVVRIGDPTMTPVDRPGLVDLATSPARDPFLELYCVSQSRFLLCGESGPQAAAYLMNTPLLTVNGTDPISAFPVRADGIYLLKTVVDRITGVALSLPEFLSEHYLANLRDPAKFAYFENTSDQILSAVEEMIALLDGATQESTGQLQYRELVIEAAQTLRHISYVRKWGVDRGFIGHGRIACSLADSWLGDESGAPAGTGAAVSF